MAEQDPEDRLRQLTLALDPPRSAAAPDEELPSNSWMGLNAATTTATAALLVAVARDPASFAEERARITEHASRVHGVRSFTDLIGDLKALRTPALAARAVLALDAATWLGGASGSELAELWAGDPRWMREIERVRTALSAAPRRWPRERPQATRPVPIHKALPPGSVIAMDLGDGQRGYALYREHSYLACFAHAEPLDRPMLSAARACDLPLAFTVALNAYEDLPETWLLLGRIPDTVQLPPLPWTFMQDLGHPQSCKLVAADFSEVIPATQQDCIGLERYGAIHHPGQASERLRRHLAGLPDPHVERTGVRISRSVFRVMAPADGATVSDTSDLPDLRNDLAYHAYYPLDAVPVAAQALGSGRSDLIAVECDQAAVDFVDIEERPLDATAQGTATVIWMRRVSRRAVLAVHAVPSTTDGRYTTAGITARYAT